MFLSSFSVTNYRSITKAQRIALDQYTVLLGKNNEGKSNMSNALQCAIEILHRFSRYKAVYSHRLYNWENDFPKQLKDSSTSPRTTFRLEFTLNDEERCEFNQLMNTNTNGVIPIQITIGKTNRPNVEVQKRGRNTTDTLKKNSDTVSEFISQRIALRYIPAIRTESDIFKVIKRSISDQLELLQENQQYIDAQQTIEELHRKVLMEIEKAVIQPLKEYAPEITSIELTVRDKKAVRYHSHDLLFDDMIIDDGVKTSIKQKGDGIKSLVAIALLKELTGASTSPIIIIEEPETHLHPEAARKLNQVIRDLSKHKQVIITTHNPLFVIVDDIPKNIIIQDGIASPAKNLEEIRSILGIKVSDNLINSKYSLVVEGETDKKSLSTILRISSPKLKQAMDQNLLSIYSLKGASNLSSSLQLLQSLLCSYVVLLDADDAGKRAYEKAFHQELIKEKDAFFAFCEGNKESEFEDCINPDIYVDKVKEDFGVNLKQIPLFKSNRKWSDRVKKSFEKVGKHWNDEVEKKIKIIVSEAVKNSTSLEKILIPEKDSFLKNLVRELEDRLECQHTN